ncbi:hypothetical protein BH09BAC6_BH09BAC6_08680 [soil metagenome]
MDATVVIPVFNQEKFITRCIESVISQINGRVEVLVVDDGSTDSTIDLIRQFIGIRILTQKNGGTSSAWNLAIENCSSKYVIGLDSDDEFFPNTIEAMMKSANNYPNAAMIYSDYVFINEDGSSAKTVFNPEPFWPVRQLLTLHEKLGQPDNFLPFGHVRLYNRQALLSAGGFNETYFYAEDFELVLRMAQQGLEFRRVPEILYKYRWHLSNKGVIYRKEQKAEVHRAVEEYRQRMHKVTESYG